MELTFVSTNPGKLAELRELCRPYDLHLAWRRRSLQEPQTDSLETVVRSKLAQTTDVPGWSLVEDSGLFLPALAGFPGVYTAHVYRIWGWTPILELLRRRSPTAIYRSVAGARRGRRVVVAHGACRGRLVQRPRGSGGFGFDPVFVPDDSRRTMAEISLSEKNRISHRGQAVRRLLRLLQVPKR